MRENKFDLNKALQAAKLYNKIDYRNLYIPDAQQTIDNFENWRKSQGYKTEEEKQEDLKTEMQAAQQRFNEQDLWNSEDPYEVYNTYQTDPEKQEEFRRNGEMVAGIGSTIATLPFTAGMMGGWIPAITTTATGAAGAFGGQKLGQYIDDKYGWNTTPGLTFAGGLFGGGVSGAIITRTSPFVLKNMHKAASKMDWSTEGVTIPTNAPKWKWSGLSRNGSYESGVVKTPLFARKSLLAHELGHYVGDMGIADPSKIRGAFTSGYKYSPSAQFERNSAENFADYFKTKLGYPYKGKNMNLMSRQNAINNSETKFFDVVRPDERLYESTPPFKVTDLNGIQKVNVKLGNVDDYWYVGHQTGSHNFPAIYKNGLRTNNGLNGTALHLTEGYMDDFANGRLIQKHMSHQGADGLVVMKFPKSKFPSGDLDDISIRLMDLGESKSFEVPSQYLQFFKRSQW